MLGTGQGLERGGGFASVSELRIVVVFDDERVRITHVSQQLRSTRGIEGDVCGAVVAGGDVDEVEPARRWDHAPIVDLQRKQLAADSGEGMFGVDVSGIFDADGGVRPDEQLCQEVESLLGSCCDEYILCIDMDAAARQNSLAQQFDQQRIVFVYGVADGERQMLGSMAVRRALAHASRGNSSGSTWPATNG